jgi:hypothetical protein
MGFAVRAPVSLPDKGTRTQIAKIEGSSLLALSLGQEDWSSQRCQRLEQVENRRSAQNRSGCCVRMLELVRTAAAGGDVFS